MKIVGIIAEYNPLHVGHLYHLQETRKQVGEDAVIVTIMSGNFVQRGEPAIFDKWYRAKKALLSGADLVIELPTYYATAAADDFAYGAAKLLTLVGATHISFGSEVTDIECLKKFVDQTEIPEFQKQLKDQLNKGLSYSVAMREAGLSLPPNALLGALYLKNLPDIKPIIISRKGSHSNSKLLPPTNTKKANNSENNTLSEQNTLDNQQEFSSATAIRTHLQNILFSLKQNATTHPHANIHRTSVRPSNNKISIGDSVNFYQELSSVSGIDYSDLEELFSVSSNDYSDLFKKNTQARTLDANYSYANRSNEAKTTENPPFVSPKNETSPVFWNHLSDLILYKIRTTSSTQLASIRDITEGFENRLKQVARNATSAEELLSLAQTKRFTDARIRRMLISALLDIQKNNTSKTTLNDGDSDDGHNSGNSDNGYSANNHAKKYQNEEDAYSKPTPNYLRILAFNAKGKAVLANIQSKNKELKKAQNHRRDKSAEYSEIITKLSKSETYKSLQNQPIDFCTTGFGNTLQNSKLELLSIDLKADALYATLTNRPFDEHTKVPYIHPHK